MLPVSDYVFAVLTLVAPSRVLLDLKILPANFRADALSRSAATGRAHRRVLDARALASTRSHLHVLALVLREIQDPHQRRAAVNPVGAALPVVACPLALHDQYTLYAGNLGLGSREICGPAPCPACGAADCWGLSATPPVVRARKLLRATHAEPVAFCWKCFATAAAWGGRR